MSLPLNNIHPSAAEAISFGDAAVRLGFLTREKIEEALAKQNELAQAGIRLRLGEILVDKGYLTEDQIERIVQGQTVTRKRVGDFELLSKLGSGAMGSVFKAKQLSMDRVIALKILSPKRARDEAFRNSFIREARAVAKLNHPHIVTGIDTGEADGFYFFAMEFVDGGTLGQMMHRNGGKIGEREGLEFARHIAMALRHAHDHNILHRDVKPENILLDNTRGVAKLADLGLAHAMDGGALNSTEQAVGTPYYISPEQARGKVDLTPATDLYSLGATLFHALTGKVPYSGENAREIMQKHVKDPPPNPRAVAPNLSQETCRIISRLMEKKPEDRYPSTRELLKDLQRALETETFFDERVVKTGSRSKFNVRAFKRRKRTAPAVSMTALMLGGGAILFLVWQLWPLLAAPKRNQMQTPPPPAKRPEPPPSTEPAALAAVPGILQAGGDGKIVFKEDFEKGAPNFDVDVRYAAANQAVKVVADADGANHVLKFAAIRHREYSRMARLLLPADAKFSQNVKLSFRAFFKQTSPATPEFQIWWNHIDEKGERVLSAWQIRDADLKAGWKRIEIPLKDPALNVAANTIAEEPQSLAIFAARGDETATVYIDELELEATVEAPKREDADKK